MHHMIVVGMLVFLCVLFLIPKLVYAILIYSFYIYMKNKCNKF